MIRLLRSYLFACLLIGPLLGAGAPATSEPPAVTVAVPLVVGQRTVHVFRAPLGAFSPAERAEGARRRISATLGQPGEGWTSTRQTAEGIQIELDGHPVFHVLPADADSLAGESPDQLAIQAARVLRTVWLEAHEQRDPRLALQGAARAGGATLLLALVLLVLIRLHARLQRVLAPLVSARAAQVGSRLPGDWGERLPAWGGRLLAIVFWLLALLLVYGDLIYSLGQFVLTRPASEQLSASLLHLVGDAVLAVAASLPGLFVAAMIFLLAWVATRIATEFFLGLESVPVGANRLNAHTAPTTRRIVHTLLWLFAVAMAYPYLPGSNTDAFKGLSVLVGLMASIGASGVVGQVVSGMMLVYTHALLRGEYVRIQEYEGVVSDIGLFETRLRTGVGQEISLPNAFVLGNVIRNYSRVPGEARAVIETRISIGYDTAWQQVHALLREASAAIPEVLATPPAQILQTALSDFYVEYLLVVYIDTAQATRRARIASDLHAAILDAFNRQGVQIMSPHYEQDPAQPKLVAGAGRAP